MTRPRLHVDHSAHDHTAGGTCTLRASGPRPRPTKVYLAGPMTWHPQFNIPAFDDGAALLRSRGYEVVSPVELDSDKARAAGMASPDGDPGPYYGQLKDTWGSLLARDVKLLSDDGIEVIYVLPDWEVSRGARLETFVGHAMHGLSVRRMDESTVSEDELIAAWAGRTATMVQDMLTSQALDAWEDEGGALHPDAREAVGSEAAADQTNPKDELGVRKAPLRLVPPALVIGVAPAMANGAVKYGAFNWREKDVRASIYGEAIQRHLYAWQDGEEIATDSGVKHLGHIGACIAILLDAEANGNLIDDRPMPGPAARLLADQDHSGD